MAEVDIYPVGTVIAMGADQVNDLWQLCDGGVLSTTEYNELFAAIQYTYGGSGTQFHVPDYRGRFLRGATAEAGVAQGFATGRPGAVFYGTAYWLPESQHECNALPSGDCARNEGSLTLNGCTSGGDAETRPPNVAVDYYIKVKTAFEA